MHSRSELRQRAARGALLLTLALLAGAGDAAPSPVSRKEVQAAVETVERDENLGGTRTQRTLRFKNEDDEAKDEEEEDDDATSHPLAWLRELSAWLAEAGRGAVWLAGMAALAVVLLRIWRWSRVRGAASMAKAAMLPSQVQSPAIPSQHLPAAIGQAAAEMWQRGNPLDALSLLYRGALSRLARAHGVPIRAASTEWECLALAQAAQQGAPSARRAARVPPTPSAPPAASTPPADPAPSADPAPPAPSVPLSRPAASAPLAPTAPGPRATSPAPSLQAAQFAHFAQVVQAWQQAVYGAQLPDTESALALCADFDRHFEEPPVGSGAA